SPVTTSKSASAGMHRMEAKPEGTLIAYASAHYQAARFRSSDRNSFYTSELLTALRLPMTDLKSAFEQVQRQVYEQTNHTQTPYLYGFLSGPLYLNGVPVESSQLARVPAIDLCAEAWAEVKDSRDINRLQRFANDFANCDQARLARLRADGLRETPRDSA